MIVVLSPLLGLLSHALVYVFSYVSLHTLPRRSPFPAASKSINPDGGVPYSSQFRGPHRSGTVLDSLIAVTSHRRALVC